MLITMLINMLINILINMTYLYNNLNIILYKYSSHGNTNTLQFGDLKYMGT